MCVLTGGCQPVHQRQWQQHRFKKTWHNAFCEYVNNTFRLPLRAWHSFSTSFHSGWTINIRESGCSPKITHILNMGCSCTAKYQVWNGGFSFSSAWRATVSTALVYNYRRHCWQQSSLCGLCADERHHFSLVSLHTCLSFAYRLASDRQKVWIHIYVSSIGLNE